MLVADARQAVVGQIDRGAAGGVAQGGRVGAAGVALGAVRLDGDPGVVERLAQSGQLGGVAKLEDAGVGPGAGGVGGADRRDGDERPTPLRLVIDRLGQVGDVAGVLVDLAGVGAPVVDAGEGGGGGQAVGSGVDRLPGRRAPAMRGGPALWQAASDRLAATAETAMGRMRIKGRLE